VSRGAFGDTVAGPSPLGPLRLLGQYRESFLVAEGDDGLVLVDQHVAHERVRYERILDRMASRKSASQRLLIPVRFEATVDEAALMERAERLLTAAGFSISELSGRAYVVSATPADCGANAVVPFLRDFLSRLSAMPEGGEAEANGQAEALAASLACHGAITVNTRLRPEEATRLLSDLAACRDPFSCPHGRPILLEFRHGELEKRFGRRG
jgi:DNA mismatch repair protein MutL